MQPSLQRITQLLGTGFEIRVAFQQHVAVLVLATDCGFCDYTIKNSFPSSTHLSLEGSR